MTMTTSHPHTPSKAPGLTPLYARACTVCNGRVEAHESVDNDETRILILSGRKIVQDWDGLGWVTVKDMKVN